LRAVRVPTLTASVIPIALGGLIGFTAHAFEVLSFVLAVLAMTFCQAASNLLNDVDDFRNEVDTKESLGSSRVVVDALLTQRQVMAAAWILFGCAAALGTYLSITKGYVIAILAALGYTSAYFYTRKPFSFKYRGFGVPLIFLMFGPLPAMGSAYIFLHRISLMSILLSVPVGFLTTAILHANDLRDIAYDARAGIRSFAMALGVRGARMFYIILIAASYLSVPLYVVLGFLSLWSLLVFLSLPLAVILIKAAFNEKKTRALDHKTAGLQLAFGLLLLVSMLF
jgi:1,4-dihydroxy-2-naphthoate polyprenyltransferase